MTDQPAPSSNTTSGDEHPLNIDLHFVSPTVGVPPLHFPGTAVTTTVQQLKERIRESLSSRPADNQQRLIYRGRLLSRDQETLRDVFGVNALRTGEQQTIHLVLSVPSSEHPHDTQGQTGPTAIPDQTSTPNLAPPHPPHPPHPLHPLHPLQPPNAQVHQLHHPRGPGAYRVDTVFHTGFVHPERAYQQHQEQLLQRLQQQQIELQRSLMAHSFAHRQHPIAGTGMHGLQGNVHNGQPGTDNAEGRNSPNIAYPDVAATRQDMGRLWMTAPNEAAGLAMPAPGAGPSFAQPGGAGGLAPNSRGRSPLSATDLHNILRGADANQATQAMTDAMNRNAAGAPLGTMANMHASIPIQPIQPGVTTPSFGSLSRHASRATTPDPSTISTNQGSSSLPGATFTSTPQPEVYILSSPTGPRGLLINSASEMYFTPAAPAARHTRPAAPVWSIPIRHPIVPPPVQPYFPASARFPTHHTPMPRPGQHQPQRQNQNQVQQQPPVQAQQQQQQQPEFPVQHGQQVHGRQLDVIEARRRPVVLFLWPHVWLIIRLAAFVWWFTSGDPSLSRWITILSIAIAVFIANTGLLNGAANQVWDPLRRHLEGLLPLADPNQPRDAVARAQPAGTAVPTPGTDATAVAAASRGDELHPARAAARLVAQRRNANANWLMDRVRRIERAGLLFLASIAPGVAERHIAQLEAQERAERQRREELATATAEAVAAQAAARAAAAAATETAVATTNTERVEQENEQAGGESQANGNGDGDVRQRQPFELQT